MFNRGMRGMRGMNRGRRGGNQRGGYLMLMLLQLKKTDYYFEKLYLAHHV